MKTIDLWKFNIIKEGIEFCVPDGNTEPGLDDLMPTMERNEGDVYWLQPKGGTVEQQEACILVIRRAQVNSVGIRILCRHPRN